jgi:predicted metal-dependent peptidase
MIIAAPVVRQDRERIGAPAKTDFVRIFICDDVTPPEYDVLLKHEQAHIWLEHNRRFVRGMEKQTWDIACELEIARNIYDEDDESIVKAPFSRIKGGYTAETIKDLPSNIIYAEAVYNWLLENKKEIDLYSCDCSKDDCEPREQPMDSESVKILVEEAKKEKQKQNQKSKSEIAAKNALDEIKNRKPTLVHEIDALLRHRIERVPSYRRPSRRSESSDVISKGFIGKPMPPLVEVFLDRSGSFTPEKTQKAQEVLSHVLKRYGASIRQDVWFFGGGKLSENDFQGGDTPYHLIIAHIEKSNPKIAVVITDGDSCCDFSKIPKTKILCVPIECNSTDFAKKTGGVDISW